MYISLDFLQLSWRKYFSIHFHFAKPASNFLNLNIFQINFAVIQTIMLHEKAHKNNAILLSFNLR